MGVQRDSWFSLDRSGRVARGVLAASQNLNSGVRKEAGSGGLGLE